MPVIDIRFISRLDNFRIFNRGFKQILKFIGTFL